MSIVPPVDISQIRFPEARHITLVVQAWSSTAYTLVIRGLTVEGPFTFRLTTPADRSVGTFTSRLTGYPLGLHLSLAQSNVRRGECYDAVGIILGGVATINLRQGYVYDGRYLGWPPGSDEDPIGGPGLLRILAGTNPAAGVEITEAVPTNALWRFAGLRFTLVTSADVATRTVNIIIDDGADTFWRVICPATQIASLTRTYLILPGDRADETAFDANNLIKLYVPPALCTLRQGWRILTQTTNLQAADDFGAPALWVEEWIQE